MNCGYCREQLNSGARFCSHCGHPVQVQTYAYGGWNSGFLPPRLMRARQGKMIGGVCAGLANHYGWDPVIIRLIAVAGLLFGCGSFFLAYVIAWIVIPIEPYYFVTMPPAGTPPGGYAGGGTGASAGGVPVS